MPYFIGAINEDSLIIESEISLLKKQLNKLLRQRRESEKIKSEGVSKANSLVEEAKEIGLISNVQTNDEREIFELLKKISKWEYEPLKAKSDNSVSKELLEERKTLRTNLNEIEDNIRAVREYQKTTVGYSKEVRQQELRLSSINILNLDESDGESKNICPLCSSEMKVPVASVAEINESLKKLQSDLQNTQKESPRLNAYIDSLQKEQNSIKTDLDRVETSLRNIYEENEKARVIRDLNIRRGKILGRISLFLESNDLLEDQSNLEIEINELNKRISDLESQIDSETEKERLLSFLNKINLQMSKWVTSLDVEYEDAPIRFDINRLTVYVDTDKKPIELSQVGSGANWVAYHLLVLFALHKHFIQNNRPVPRFIILDQPTQVYYPPESNHSIVEIGESSDDRAVNQMFKFILDVTASMAPDLQVIITDHANLSNNQFQESVIEVWREGNKLIPDEWEDVYK